MEHKVLFHKLFSLKSFNIDTSLRFVLETFSKSGSDLYHLMSGLVNCKMLM